jgi:hypothetical protein
MNNGGMTLYRVIYVCNGCDGDPCYLTFKTYARKEEWMMVCPFSGDPINPRRERFELLDFDEVKEE